MAVEDVKQSLADGDSRHREVQVAARRDQNSVLEAAHIADQDNPRADRIRGAIRYLFSDLRREVKGIVEEDNCGRAARATRFYHRALEGSSHVGVGELDDPVMLSMRAQFTAEKVKGMAAVFPDVLDRAESEILTVLDKALGKISLYAQEIGGLTEDVAEQSQAAVAASQAVSERI